MFSMRIKYVAFMTRIIKDNKNLYIKCRKIGRKIGIANH